MSRLPQIRCVHETTIREGINTYKLFAVLPISSVELKCESVKNEPLFYQIWSVGIGYED